MVDLDDDDEQQEGRTTMDVEDDEQEEEEEEDDDDERQRIPPELLTRILHEFFEQEGTRITRDANEAVARYVDVFVREAIARAAVEREGGFLEVGFFSFSTCSYLVSESDLLGGRCWRVWKAVANTGDRLRTWRRSLPSC